MGKSIELVVLICLPTGRTSLSESKSMSSVSACPNQAVGYLGTWVTSPLSSLLQIPQLTPPGNVNLSLASLPQHKVLNSQNSSHTLLDNKDISTCICTYYKLLTNCELLEWGLGPFLSAFVPDSTQIAPSYLVHCMLTSYIFFWRGDSCQTELKC